MALGNRISNRLKLNDFVKNVATLLSGNLIAAAVNAIGTPVLSRLISPGQMGEYDMIISSSSILLVVLQLALMLVIMVPKDERESVRICKIILCSSFAGSLLVLLVLACASPWYRLFDTELNYYLAVALMCAYIILFNTESIYYSFVNRQKLYRILFYTPIVLSTSNILISMFLLIAGGGTLGYLFGTLTSQAIASGFMAHFVNPFKGRDSVSSLWQTIKKYKDYPLIQLPANLINSVSSQLPTQVLGRIFGYAMLGGYTMATRLLSIPINLLATPINKVYYRELVEKVRNNDKPGELAYSVIKNNFRIAILPIGILVVFGDLIASVLLGEEWRVSGIYITILGFLYLFDFCTACTAGTFVATGNQKISIKYAICTVVQIALTFLAAYVLSFDVTMTVILYTASMGINKICLLLLTMHVTGFPKGRMIAFLFKWVGLSAIIIYSAYVLRLLFMPI